MSAVQSTEPTDAAQDYIQGLRDLADFLTEHSEFMPSEAAGGVDAMEYCLTREQLVSRARAIGGEWQQRTDGRFVKLERRFGPHSAYLFIKAELVGEPVTFTRTATEFRVPDLLAECPDCHGEAKHNPSPRRDPQAEIDCDTCQGSGEAL